MPGPNKNMGTPRPTNLKHNVGRLIGYLKPYRGRMAVVFVCILLQCACNILATSMLTPLLNGLSAKDATVTLTGIAALDNLALTDKTAYLFTMVGVIAGIYLLSLSANYILNRIMVGVSTGTIKRLRTDLFEHMQRLPIKVFDNTTHGELMTRYTNDVDMMNEFIARCIPQMVNSLVTILGVFTAMFILNWALALIMVGMLAIMLVIGFGRIEYSGMGNFGDNWSGIFSPGIEAVDFFDVKRALLFADIKNGGTKLTPGILSLPVQRSRVVRIEKNV